MYSLQGATQTKAGMLSAKLNAEVERSKALRGQLQTELRLMVEIVSSYRQSLPAEPLFDLQMRQTDGNNRHAEGSEGDDHDEQQVVPTVYVDGLKLYPKTSTVMEMVNKALASQQQQHSRPHQHQPSFA